MAQKKFTFRLQTILDYKYDMEEKEKEKLAKVLAELEKAYAYKAMLEQKKEQAKIELRQKQQAGEIDVNQLRFYTHFLKKLDNDILQAALMIEQIKMREREQRAALLKAAQERQAYEKLKEKHKEEFDAEEEEAERKLIDELATIKFARRQMEEAAAAAEEEADLEGTFIGKTKHDPENAWYSQYDDDEEDSSYFT